MSSFIGLEGIFFQPCGVARMHDRVRHARSKPNGINKMTQLFQLFVAYSYKLKRYMLGFRSI